LPCYRDKSRRGRATKRPRPYATQNVCELEMAQHKSFTMATDVQVYFCDPQSPWQRGSHENTNGLSDLDEIALRLNQRPRKTLGFHTPADKLRASVASTP
jgi:IS30 family transposase